MNNMTEQKFVNKKLIILLLILSPFFLLVIFNFLIGVRFIKRDFNKLYIEVLDAKTKTPIQSAKIVYLLSTSDQDDLPHLLFGHISHSENLRKYDSKYSSKNGTVLIDEFYSFFKLFEYYRYELLIVNSVPLDSNRTDKENFYDFGFKENFQSANPKYEMLVVLINASHPGYKRTFSLDGKIRVAQYNRKSEGDDSIKIFLNEQ